MVNALCADRQFSHGEAGQRLRWCSISTTPLGGSFLKPTASSSNAAFEKYSHQRNPQAQAFGYPHYEKHGGRNERNTYHLKKLTQRW